jgi:hypothetical protein
MGSTKARFLLKKTFKNDRYKAAIQAIYDELKVVAPN